MALSRQSASEWGNKDYQQAEENLQELEKTANSNKQKKHSWTN
jgi:hypothetical protein